MDKINDINRFLVRAEKIVAGALISGISICVLFQVIFRYLLKSPLAWSDEMSRYLLVWMVFVGAAVATDRLSHFHMDVIRQFIPASFSRHVDIGVLLAMFVFAASIAIFGVQILGTVHRQFSPAMEVKMSYAYLAMPIGGTLMCWHLAVHLLNKFLASNENPEPDGDL
jgi:TRAP-type C4-dicarboxylate transport system permease small subunit